MAINNRTQITDAGAVNVALVTGGALNVNVVSGGGSSGNAAAGLTGSVVPTSADYLGFSISGLLTGVSSSNPLPVSVSGGSSNASAGTTGSAVPTSASYTSWNSVGNNTGVSLTTALPIQPGTGASFPVTGTFWQATQPVSLTSTTITGTVASTQSGTWNIGSVATLPALPTGANTIGAVNVNGTLPVSGSFYQATQPVSIASMPSTPVTGTFWQSTQPVSIASMPSTTVTGTFWQVTQPVSLASTTITGTVAATQSGTWNIGSITTFPALPTGANTIGSVNIAAAQTLATVTTVGTVSAITAGPAITAGFYSRITDGISVVAVKAASTAAVATDPAQVVAISPNNSVTVAQTTPANLNATVTPIALTKGTQGATGFTTQDLKDSGRNQTNYFNAAQTISTATETLLSLTGYKSGASVTATTTPAVVTTGKTYRISRITMSYIGISTATTIQVNLRANIAGVVAVTSPLVDSWVIGEQEGSVASVAGGVATINIANPDGIEFAAGTGIGITLLGTGATGTAIASGYAKISIAGYEY